jgi:hypothetical protein
LFSLFPIFFSTLFSFFFLEENTSICQRPPVSHVETRQDEMVSKKPLRMEAEAIFYILLMQAINRAAKLPISIIIVGIGGKSFGNMERLDGDHIETRDGVKVRRDIVQFVPLRKFDQHNAQDQQLLLAKEVLAEVPAQVVSFMKSRGFKPRQPNIGQQPVGVPPPQNVMVAAQGSTYQLPGVLSPAQMMQQPNPAGFPTLPGYPPANYGMFPAPLPTGWAAGPQIPNYVNAQPQSFPNSQQRNYVEYNPYGATPLPPSQWGVPTQGITAPPRF